MINQATKVKIAVNLLLSELEKEAETFNGEIDELYQVLDTLEKITPKFFELDVLNEVNRVNALSNAQIAAEVLEDEGFTVQVMSDDKTRVLPVGRVLDLDNILALCFYGTDIDYAIDGLVITITKPEQATEPTPNPDCPHCHGTGEVYDYVPYGNTSVPMPSGCSCLDYREDE